MKRFYNKILFLAIVVALAYFYSCSDDIISRKSWNNTLFESSHGVKFKKRCFKDIIGASIEGSVFDFYHYNVEGVNQIDTSLEFPRFDMMFDTSKLLNVNFSYWKNTPIHEKKEDSSALVFIAKNSSLREFSCSENFLNRDLLSKNNSYYSFFGAYPIGDYLFVYSPIDSSLFIIVRK